MEGKYISAKPILFNTEMIQAILDGRKTCTRRLVKFLPGENPQWTGYEKDGLMLYNGRNEPCIYNSPYHIGDILYVRETWTNDKFIFGNGAASEYRYKADKNSFLDTAGTELKIRWKPSIHMPKEAARIWLKITNIRVERLHDITNDEAIKEGAEGEECYHAGAGPFGCTDCMNTGWIEPPVVNFVQIWESTLTKTDKHLYSWDANPYVYVIDFERINKPETV